MGVRRFEDLLAWQHCMGLAHEVFRITSEGEEFGDEDLRKQLRRAASAAPSLIAEGFLRFTTAELIRYLRMARGELGEIQSHLLLARGAAYLSAEEFTRISPLADRAMATTTGLLKAKLRQQEAESRSRRRKRTTGR
jgi:four helix bundle protein